MKKLHIIYLLISGHTLRNIQLKNKDKKIIIASIALIFCITTASAQNFSRIMKQQNAAIKAAYKKHQITEKEYYKLNDEQSSIKEDLEKYNGDGHLSSDEKNKIASKQQRAAARLRKYKTNKERY